MRNAPYAWLTPELCEDIHAWQANRYEHLSPYVDFAVWRDEVT